MSQSLSSQEEATGWMHQLGHDRSQGKYQVHREEGKLTLAPAGQHLLRQVFTVYREAVQARLQDKKWRKAGYAQSTLPQLLKLGHGRIALVVCRLVLDGSAISQQWSTLANKLGAMLYKEYQCLEARRQAPKDFQRIWKALEGGASRGYYLRGMNRLLQELKLDLPTWTQTEKAAVGNLFLALFVETLDILETRTHDDASTGKSVKLLYPTEAYMNWLEASVHAHGEQNPVKVPMLEPPDDWTGLFTGGYPEGSLVWEVPLIGARGVGIKDLKRVVERKFQESASTDLNAPRSVCYPEDGGGDAEGSVNDVTAPNLPLNGLKGTGEGGLGVVKEGGGSGLLTILKRSSSSGATPPRPPHQRPLGTFRDAVKTVNDLQKVPYRVNRDIWEVVSHLHSTGKEVGHLLSQYDEPLPEKPFLPTEEELRLYKLKASQTYRANRDNKIKRIVNARLLGWGERFLNQDFYLVHNFDFRGRMYPVSTILNYQHTDLVRGMMEFAIRQPITTEAQVDALRVAMANAWGEDKSRIEDRLQWVAMNEGDIRRLYQDPLDSGWWQEADEPWQFLSLAMEYGRFLEEGFGMESGVPVHVDGTCNGLQAYSLLLRDSVGGLATNVVPDDKPHDIYKVVADEVTRLLEASEERLARRWLSWCGGSIPRSLTKRPVMTKPYGCSRSAIIRYVLDWYREELHARALKEGEFGQTGYSGAFFMATMIERAFDAKIKASVEGMDWLRSVVRTLAEHDLHFEWESPLGFPCMQRYSRLKKEVVKTSLHGRIYSAVVQSRQDDRIAVRKSCDAGPPNFIHSLDAAAAQQTIRLCVGHGVRAVATIHDSYGTTAAHAPQMARLLREAWVQVFTPNLLEDLRDQQLSRLPAGVSLPDLPAIGDLDVRELMNSRYFFN